MPVTPKVVGRADDGVFYANGAKAPVVMVTELDGTRLPKPLETKVLMPGPKGSLIEYHLSKGQVIPPHRFAHDFINCVVKGKIKVNLAEREYEGNFRDAWAGAAGVKVALEALEDSVLLEWMGPPHLLSGSRLVTWGTAPATDAHLFTRFDDVEEFESGMVEGTPEVGPPGVDIRARVKVLIPGPYGALVWISHRKQKWALHAHQHNFLCYLIKGKMKEKFGGTQVHIANSGDIWAGQAGAVHCTEALADNELFEFKWPAPMLWRGTIQSWEPKR